MGRHARRLVGITIALLIDVEAVDSADLTVVVVLLRATRKATSAKVARLRDRTVPMDVVGPQASRALPRCDHSEAAAAFRYARVAKHGVHSSHDLTLGMGPNPTKHS